MDHWFFMLDISDSPSTATMWQSESVGEYSKRDLDQQIRILPGLCMAAVVVQFVFRK
jgi:hypothetical protein